MSNIYAQNYEEKSLVSVSIERYFMKLV